MSTSMRGENWALLNFEDAMAEMEHTINLFKEGKIAYIIYDKETSHAMEPWGGGDVIMFSWAHTMSNIGYAVPTVVNNRIDFPLEEIPYPIPHVHFDITIPQRAKLLAKLREMLELIPIAGHNLKYDVRWGIWHGLMNPKKLKIIADTLVIAFQLFNKPSNYATADKEATSLSLKALAKRLANVADDWEFYVHDYLGRYRLNKDKHFGNIPTGLLGEYAAKDSIYNRYVLEVLVPMVPPYMWDIINKVTYAIKCYSDAEILGMTIDQDMKVFLENNYGVEQKKCMDAIMQLPRVKALVELRMAPLIEKNNKKKKNKKTVEELRDEAFSITSNKDLVEIIYGKEHYGVEPMASFKTDGGAPQVSSDFIEYYVKKLAGVNFEEIAKEQYAEIGKIVFPEERARQLKAFEEDFGKPWELKTFLENLAVFKKLEKLRTTYIRNLDSECIEGSYKPEFQLTFVKTGRLSSGFHTLPKASDIKRMYTSRWQSQGGLFVAVDQSQLELRIVAALANEQKLIDAFKSGADAHKITASNIYKVPLEEVTEKMRKVGKITNFAVLYGKHAKNLAPELEVSVPEAEKILDGFFSGYDKLTSWIQEQQKFVMENAYVLTKWGRKIPVDEAKSHDKWVRMKAMRTAVNYPVQSTASDVVLASVLGIWNRIKYAEKLNSHFLGSVHDSIEIDCYPGELFQVLRILQEEGVENVIKANPWISCPLELSFEIGKSWGGALECSIESLEQGKLIFKGSGLRKDLLQFKAIAEKAYNFQYEVLEEKDTKEKDFGVDTFMRDSKRWKTRVVIESLNIQTQENKNMLQL